MLATEPSDCTLLLGLGGEPHSQQSRLALRGDRDLGDGAGKSSPAFLSVSEPLGEAPHGLIRASI